jgi:hypothetical protein
MKKDRRKLALGRETVRNLTTGDLRRAYGGGATTVQCIEYSECQCQSEGGGCQTTTEQCPSGGTVTSSLCQYGAYC